MAQLCLNDITEENMKRAMPLLVLLALPLPAIAASHGPVFGLATNSQGEWSFDQGVFGRSTSLSS
jgi:hypothetical protein